MFKSSNSQNPQKSQHNLQISGDVINGNIILGNDNVININAIAVYGRFTIPQPAIDFTGREEELAELKDSFSRGAIITGISGAGGIGKTELARKLAQDISENYPDAQMNIELLGTSEKQTSPEDAMRRLLEPFHAGEKLPDDETQLKNLYLHTFGKKKVLLLLDNAANAAQVRPLIPPAPSAAIITSRQHFSLTEFGLHEPLRLDVLSSEKAREFLGSASPKLNGSPDEEVNELAKLCGHLPLALRVAVSLLNDRSDWTVNTLINRLQDEHIRLKRLKREGDYDVEATLSLSYELLSDDLKKHFRALGIFTAPFAKISAKAVLGIEDDNELDDVLGKLIGRSLLNHRKSQEIVEGVYFTHDLMILYATQRLLEANEYEEVRTRHAEHFLKWAGEANTLYNKGNEHILQSSAQFRFIWIHLYSAYERLVPEQKTFPRPQIADHWLSEFPYRCLYVFNQCLQPRKKIVILQSALNATRRLGDKYEGIYLMNIGGAYWEAGDTHNAIVYYEKSLSFARENSDREEEGWILNNLGIGYWTLGDAHKAIELYEQALAICREFEGRDYEGYILDNLGNAYLSLGDVHKAIEYHKKALIICSEVGDRHCKGNVLGNLGTNYEYLGDLLKAIDFYEQALVIDRKFNYHRGEGNILGHLGSVYVKLGDLLKAIDFYGQALVIHRQTENRRGEAGVLGDLGKTYAQSGDTQKAIDFYEQVLVICGEIGNRQGEGGVLRILGNAYIELGDMRKAIDFYEKELAIHREFGDCQDEGNLLQNLGNAYATLGDTRKAVDLYEQALIIHREIGNRHDEGDVLGNLGIMHEKIGYVQKSIEFSEQALAIYREIKNRQYEANVLGDLGMAYSDLGNAQKSIDLYEQALIIHREIGNRRGEGSILGNLGAAYSDLGNMQKSIEFFEQALAFYREIGNRHYEGVVLEDLGNVYINLGDARKSIELYEQALVIHREIGDLGSEGNILTNLGSAYKTLGERDKAKDVWQETLNIFRTIENPHAATIERLLVDDLDISLLEQKQGALIRDFAYKVFQSVRTKNPEAQQLFDQVSKMVSDSSLPVEIQELAKVLRNFMAGIKNPDLSHLTNEFAQLVREELERNE